MAVRKNIKEYVVENMKSPKEDYEIRKLVVSDLGTREYLYSTSSPFIH